MKIFIVVDHKDFSISIHYGSAVQAMLFPMEDIEQLGITDLRDKEYPVREDRGPENV